jgi:hypothetical protein
MQAHRGLRFYKFVTSEKELGGQPGKISGIPCKQIGHFLNSRKSLS